MIATLDPEPPRPPPFLLLILCLISAVLVVWLSWQALAYLLS